MSRSTPKEPVVRHSNPMPPGYVFVPKGNVYVTGNCRRQTQASNQIVYAVVSRDKRTLGIRVPASIHSNVLASEASTREDRAAVVQKRDLAEERVFRQAILKLFPKMPAEAIPQIVSRALKKRSGRVGRSGRLDVEVKATLAVRAHVRHVHTKYDIMLRKGAKREKARDQTLDKINEVLKAWGGRVAENRHKKRKAKRDGAGNGDTKMKPKTMTVNNTVATKNTRTVTKKTRTAQTSRCGVPKGKPAPGNSRKPHESPRARRFRKLKARRPRGDTTILRNSKSTWGSMGKSLRNLSDTDDESDEYDGSDGDSYESSESVEYEGSESEEYEGSETDDDDID